MFWRRRDREAPSVADAAFLLGRKPLGKRREVALLVLGDAFCHVELPTCPIVVTPAEQVAITRSAATELGLILRPASADQAALAAVKLLSGKCDLLWREVAAANWDVVVHHETLRVVTARQAVVQVARMLEARSAIESETPISFVDVLQAMLRELEDGTSHLSRQLDGPLGELGAGIPHARLALRRELDRAAPAA